MNLSLEQVEQIMKDDNASGTVLQKGRNTVKRVSLDDGNEIVIKSFKRPNVINQFAYRYIRKSKAQRSFEYAQHLLDMGIATPEPLQYIESETLVGLQASYYISSFFDYDYDLRHFFLEKEHPRYQEVIESFAHFMNDIHNKGINFLDNSQGNTLLRFNDDTVEFALVDINRMKFQKSLHWQQRIYNMRKLFPDDAVAKIFATTYAQLNERDVNEVLHNLKNASKAFEAKFKRRKNVKKKLGLKK